MKHIICFHLFNDYSGSPKVLKMVLQGILDKGYEVDLITSKGGVLDELTGHANLKRVSYGYHFSANPLITMSRYLGVQLYTFLIAFRYLFQKQTVFYINTLLPVGPALAVCRNIKDHFWVEKEGYVLFRMLCLRSLQADCIRMRKPHSDDKLS